MRKKLISRASICAAVAAICITMGSITASAADLTPGNASTIYNGTVLTTQYNGTTKSVPSTADRCSLRYFGVDKYQKNAEDVVVKAYHIVEGNYSKYGFLGWTETKAAADIVKFESFQKTTDNVVQVVIEDNDPKSPTYNKKKVITSSNITDLSRAIISDAKIAAKFESVDLEWNEEQHCYMNKNAESGMYLVLVEKEDRGIIYNPVIISNDYTNANVAESLSNVTATKDGPINTTTGENKIHDAEDQHKTDIPHETGVNKNNTAFVGYGSYHPTNVSGIATNENRDKAPKDQTDYMTSHKSVVYYKDTQLNGNVYSVFKGKTTDADIETMALKGKAYAKKSTIPLEKNIVNASVPKTYTNDIAADSKRGYSKYDDVAEGDIVTYDIFTEIPNYADGYFKDEQKFLFKITDTQHEGLAAVDTSKIKVYVADSTAVDAQNVAADIVKDTNLVTASDTTFKITASDNTFDVEFAKDYCLKNIGKKIIVSYETTVTDKAAKGLNGNPNEVYLEYTTLPTQPTHDSKPSRGYKFDFAVQYTFSPTAFKLGEDGEITKVDGKNVVTVEDQDDIAKGEKVSKPLAGAKFKLQRVGTHYTADNKVAITDIAPDTTKYNANPDTKFAENGYRTWFLTSDDNGVLKFSNTKGEADTFDGIDEGIYTLQEVEAPKDYTINEKIYVIEVNPTFDTDQRFIGTDVKVKEADKLTYDGMTFVDGRNYEYDQYNNLLRSYKYSEWVTEQADNYSGSVADIAASKEVHNTVVSYEVTEGKDADKIAETDLIGIIDTKLTRLPSTGGIGTILFTVGGFALMGAGAYIVAKKDKDEEDVE